MQEIERKQKKHIQNRIKPEFMLYKKAANNHITGIMKVIKETNKELAEYDIKPWFNEKNLEKAITKMLEDNQCWVLVDYFNNVLGFMGYQTDSNDDNILIGKLNYFAISPNYQKTRTVKDFYTFSEMLLEKEKVNVIQVKIMRDNLFAKEFFEKKEFKEVKKALKTGDIFEKSIKYIGDKS